MAYEDLLSGAIALPSVSGDSSGGGSSSGTDWGSLISAGLGAATTIAGTLLGSRAVKPIVKAVVGGPAGLPGLPSLGTGNMSMPASFLSLGPGGINLGSGDFPPSLGGGGAPMSMPAVPGGGVTRRGPIYFTYTTPRGGTAVGGYRSLGRPMLWSGDLAAVHRVARVARKLGRFHRRSSRRF